MPARKDHVILVYEEFPGGAMHHASTKTLVKVVGPYGKTKGKAEIKRIKSQNVYWLCKLVPLEKPEYEVTE